MQRPPSSAETPRRQISFLVALVVCIATPATVALSYYHLTGDPAFQPLALTVERLVARGEEVRHPLVQTIVQSDGTPEGVLRARKLGQDISRAFYGKGVEAMIRLDPIARPGPPSATFLVGRSRYGPYTVTAAAQGVRASVDALALARSAQQPDRRHRW